MTKLEEKLNELGYEYKERGLGVNIYVKKFFFHLWIVVIDTIDNTIINADFGTPVLNFIAYIRYKKDLKELKLCQD